MSTWYQILKGTFPSLMGVNVSQPDAKLNQGLWSQQELQPPPRIPLQPHDVGGLENTCSILLCLRTGSLEHLTLMTEDGSPPLLNF